MTVLFFLAVYGAAISVAVLKLGLPLRRLAAHVPPRYERKLMRDGKETVEQRSVLMDFLSCPPCLSFWIAALFSRFAWSPSAPHLRSFPWWYAAVADGLAAVAVSWILHVITERVAPEHV